MSKEYTSQYSFDKFIIKYININFRYIFLLFIFNFLFYVIIIIAFFIKPKTLLTNDISNDNPITPYAVFSTTISRTLKAISLKLLPFTLSAFLVSSINLSFSW